MTFARKWMDRWYGSARRQTTPTVAAANDDVRLCSKQAPKSNVDEGNGMMNKKFRKELKAKIQHKH